MDRLRQLGDNSRVIGTDRMTEVDLVDRKENMLGWADEGVHRIWFRSVDECGGRSVRSLDVDRLLRGIGGRCIRGERCSPRRTLVEVGKAHDIPPRCLVEDLDASATDQVGAVDRLHDGVGGGLSRCGYADAGRLARRRRAEHCPDDRWRWRGCWRRQRVVGERLCCLIRTDY
jgi:hypothetical protein